MEAKLPNFTTHHVLSRQKDFDGLTGHLTPELLEKLLCKSDRQASIFICGPPPMMKATSRHLKALQFRGSRIYTEKFSY